MPLTTKKRPAAKIARKTGEQGEAQAETAKQHGTKARTGGATRAKATQTVNEILAWEDDPMSATLPIKRPVPKLPTGRLALRIGGATPRAQHYQPGTTGFRYWTAAESLARGVAFWGAVLPNNVSWAAVKTLRVLLDAGVDLNAYYDRDSLSFFHDVVGGQTVYSGESPDIVNHELGHAILDALRPQLWDAASVDAAAFHESFGDISAILVAAQLPGVRRAVLDETGGKLYRSSRLSRVAEQLGWALRQFRPQDVDADSLRNAVNSFFYRDPDTLPTSAPATQLSSQPHSFSRVFTGAFFESLAGMLSLRSRTPTPGDLLRVCRDAARLLVDAIARAPIVADYFTQIAAHMLEADQTRFNGVYRDALKSAFVRHGILSLEAATALTGALSRNVNITAGRGATGATATTINGASGVDKLPQLALSAQDYGLGASVLVVEQPVEVRRFSVSAAALAPGSLAPPTGETAAKSFVEDLFRRGRIDVGDYGPTETRLAHPFTRKTHFLRKPTGRAGAADQLVLVRRSFDCGFD